MNALAAIAMRWSWENVIFAMIHTLWQGAAVAAMLWVTLRATPARYARLRYAAAAIALVAILLAGMTTWSLLDRGLPVLGRQFSRIPLPVAPLNPPTDRGDHAAAMTSPQTSRIPWTNWAGWIWTAGAAVMILRAGVATARSQRLAGEGELLTAGPAAEAVAELSRRMRLRRRVRVVASAAWEVPAVIGFVWPTLLLPLSLLTDWPVSALRMVIAHELAHVRRWDFLANFCQQVIEAVLFFNPAVWWISRQVRIEREACCDAWAVKVTGAAGEAARTLAGYAERISAAWTPRNAALALGGVGRRSLLDRIKRILRPDERPHVAAPWYAAAAATACAVLLLGALRVGADVAVKTIDSLLSAEDVGRIASLQKAQDGLAHPDDAATVEVHGVLRTADGAPLPKDVDVSIHVDHANGSTGYSATIGKDGHFRQKVRAGMIRIVASCKEFAPVFTGVMKADEKGTLPEVRLVLEPGFTAPMRVVDAAGAPIGGAVVDSAYVQAFVIGQQKQTTDPDGLVRLTHSTAAVPARVRVEAHGFEFEQRDVWLSDDGKAREIKLTPAKVTTGTVVDAATGAPIAGAEVKLLERKGFADETFMPHGGWGAPQLLAKTGGDGRFILDELRGDCEYAIRVSAEGHGSEVFTGVGAGQNGLRWKLGPERVIRGQITGDLARLSRAPRGTSPIVTAVVTEWARPESEFSYTANIPVKVADGVGTFTLADPMPGYVTLHVPGQDVRVETSAIPKLVELRVASADAPPPAKRQVVFQFDVPPGAPPPQGKLRVFHFESNAYLPTDRPVENGTVSDEIAVPGMVGYDGGALAGYWTPQKVGIDVPAGKEPLEIHVPVIPAGAVHGRVLEPDGTPCANFYVSVITVRKSPAVGDSAPWLQNFNSADVSGTFLLGALPLDGTYKFIGVSSNRIVASDDITIDAQTPIRDVTLKFPEGLPVRAQVVDEQGKPRRGVEVSLDFKVADSGYGLSPRRTNEDGVVTFEHVNPDAGGEYSLSIKPERDYAGQTVPAAVDGQPITLSLHEGLKLKGQVLDANTGQPIATAKVTAHPQYGHGPASRRDVETTADGNGRFQFDDLDQGDYWLQVEGTLPPGATVEQTPDGGRRVHFPDNWQTVVTAGQSDEMVMKVQREK